MLSDDKPFSHAPARRSAALAALGCAAFLQGCGGGGGGPSDGGDQPPPQPPPVVSKGSVSLVAGSIGSPGNLDGVGSAARFDRPWGLAVGPDGNLYVADLRNRRIRRVTRAGAVSTFAGSGEPGNADGTGGAATFCSPSDVAVDPAGNVFVATQAAVRKITPDAAAVTTVAGVVGTVRCGGGYAGIGQTPAPAAPKAPTAIAVDALGVAYIGDASPGAVYALTPSGVLTRLTGGGGDRLGNPVLGFPSGLALDAARNVYVADAAYGRILRITPSGQLTTLAAAVPPGPSDPSSGSADLFRPPGPNVLGTVAGLAADAAGNLYVADPSWHVVRRVTPSGAISVVAGAEGRPGSIDGARGSARLDTPRGVALGSDATTLFVSDGANTIRSVDLLSGSVSTLAGLATPPEPGFRTFHATDRAGNVYVAEQVATYPRPADYAIRRIAPDGTTTTLLGGGLAEPRGMALDSAGNLYVVDALPSGNYCGHCYDNVVVRRITPQGGMTLFAGTLTPVNNFDADGIGSAAALRTAYGLAIDAADNLYVSQTNGSLRKITPDGAVSTLSRISAGSFYPRYLAVDAAGSSLYVGLCPDRLEPGQPPGGGALFKVDLRSGGAVAVLAGSLTEAGFRDGAGAQARFGGCLSGVALDAAGNVFVYDATNAVVRKIAPDGAVSTVVGQPGRHGITLGSLPATLTASLGRDVSGVGSLSFDAAGNLYVGSPYAILRVQFAD